MAKAPATKTIRMFVGVLPYAFVAALVLVALFLASWSLSISVRSQNTIKTAERQISDVIDQLVRFETDMVRLELLSGELDALIPTLKTEESTQMRQPVVDIDVAFENRIKTLEVIADAIRQAIIPTEPQEILTIARLSDQVGLINHDLETINRKIDTKTETTKSVLIERYNGLAEIVELLRILIYSLLGTLGSFFIGMVIKLLFESRKKVEE